MGSSLSSCERRDVNGVGYLPALSRINDEGGDLVRRDGGPTFHLESTPQPPRSRSTSTTDLIERFEKLVDAVSVWSLED